MALHKQLAIKQVFKVQLPDELTVLNAVLDTDDRKKLVSLEIIDNKELTKELIYDKTGRLDVRAKTADGMQIDIEVQLTNQKNMEKRTMFYWGKLFLDGIKKGDDYINLIKVITINILDFDFLDIDKFHSKYHLWEDEEQNYLLTDLVEIHFIEVSKFRRFTDKDLKGNALHRWLKFFDKMLSEDELKEMVFIVFSSISMNASRIASHLDIFAVALLVQGLFFLINYIISILVGRSFFSHEDALALVLAIAMGLAATAFGPNAALMVSLAFLIQPQAAVWFIKLNEKYGFLNKGINLY